MLAGLYRLACYGFIAAWKGIHPISITGQFSYSICIYRQQMLKGLHLERSSPCHSKISRNFIQCGAACATVASTRTTNSGPTMGGVVAGRLGSGAGFSGTDSKDPSILGAYGGRETHTITTAQLPPYTPSGTVATSTSGTVPVQGNATGTSVPNKVYYGKNDTAAIDLPITVSSSSSFTGNAQGGTSAAHNNTQPTMICNYILFAGA